MNKNILLASAALSVVPTLVAAKAPGKRVQPKQPNIIFILCDDMGYGDLACYGQPYISTPNIDRMAEEGMRFTQAYAGSPVSAPSRASIMTGQHSGHGHVRGNREYWSAEHTVVYGNNVDFAVVGQEPYDPQHKILPEMLKDHGYTGGKVHIAHCGNLEAAKRLQQMIHAVFHGAQVDVSECGGLCSYYAELGGLMVGFEDGV